MSYSVITFGGKGGDQFPMNAPLKSIGLRGGKYVDQIQINGNSYGGGGGAEVPTITLSEGEFINKVDIRSGSYIDYLKLTTNKGQTIEIGGGGGTPSSIHGKIIALSGRSGKYVDNLQFLISNE